MAAASRAPRSTCSRTRMSPQRRKFRSDRLGDSRPRRPHCQRRAEPRQHHRWLPPLARQDPRVRAQGCRRSGENSDRTVSAILGPEDHIVSDELNHASIIDGCRLSRAKIHVFAHKDVAAAEKILGELDSVAGRKLLITDGVFSMDGDIGALPGLTEAAERHGAMMMVDDAHASGVLGRNGRGTIDHFGLDGRVHIQVGTLSKAIGVLGGYVCGSRDLIEFLYHRARPFLFSTSHPPAVAAACLAAFDVLEEEPERIAQLWENTRYFKAGLKSAGFNTGISETPITPVIVGDAALAHQLSRELFEEGVLATGIGFPTVAKGKARVRTIVASTHTKAELDRALDVFRKVGKKLGILAA